MSDNTENRVYRLEVKMESLETFLEKKMALEFQLQNSKIDSLEQKLTTEINSVKTEIGSVKWMMTIMLSVLLANVGISLGIFYFMVNYLTK